jgi:hypothetical protein
MSDANNIYALYMENAAKQVPTLTTTPEGNKLWRLNGVLHRKDGPAMESADGDKFWYHHGALHREDGPAAVWPGESQQWYLHGKLHREDGPAIEYYNDDDAKEWWLNDVQYADANAWAQAVLKLHNKPHAADDAERFLRVILTKEDLL